MGKKTKLILKGILEENGQPFKREIRTLDEVRESGQYTLVGYNVSEDEGLPPAEYDDCNYCFIEALLSVTRNSSSSGYVQKETIGQTITISNREDGGTNIYNRSWSMGKNNEEWTPWLMIATGNMQLIAQNNDVVKAFTEVSENLDATLERIEKAEDSISKNNEKVLEYATVRFDRIEENVTIINAGEADSVKEVVYYKPSNIFVAADSSGAYWDTWSGRDAYMRDNAIYENKLYICGNQSYIWDGAMLCDVSEKVITLLQAEISRANKAEQLILQLMNNIKPVEYSGTVFNSPDEEDITQVDNALKLKDRPWGDGMGYVILRKNKPLQEQLTEENTIYEVRYDFDLNEEEITIPNNCVLCFMGGSFSNGKIIGDEMKINALNSYIFRNVYFGGQIKDNYKFCIDWFIPENYTDSIEAKKDCAEYINFALNSGIKNVEFTSTNFYYVKNTIVIDNKDVKLLSDIEDLNWQHSFRSTQGLRGCIYSDAVVTILDYKYKSEVRVNNTPYIGNITFLCLTPFESSDKIDVPIVRFTTYNEPGMWGMVMNCNVYGRMLVNGDLNYTGIEINTVENTGYIAFLTMKGNIQYTYCGIRMNRAEGTFINNVDLYGSTWCVIGGIFQAGAIQIFGGHQTAAKLWQEKEWDESAYFTALGQLSLYNYVWDITYLSAWTETARLAVKHTVKSSSAQHIFRNEDLVRYDRAKFVETRPELYFQAHKYLHAHNILNRFSTPNAPNLIKNVSYKINGEDILSTNLVKLYNSHTLFNGETNLRLNSFDNPNLVDVDLASVVSMSDIKADFEVVIKLNKHHVHLDEQSYVPLIHRCKKTSEITITDDDTSEIVNSITTNASSAYYYHYAAYVEDLFNRGKHTKITITIRFSYDMTAGTIYPLPHISIPISKSPTIFCGIKRPAFNDVNSNKNIGFIYFDTALQKPIWWNGAKWVDATGVEV